MILLSGYSASGKSTVGNILENEGFWLVDSGPYWRKIMDVVAPDMNQGEFHFMMRDYTGDPSWEDNALAALIRNTYERGMHTKRDLVLAGYRNVDEANFVASKLEGKVFPEHRKSIMFVKAPLEISLQRYQSREGLSISREEFELYREDEKVRGIEEFRNAADIIIENTGNETELETSVRQAVYERLGYPPEITEGRTERSFEIDFRVKRYFDEKGYPHLGNMERPTYRNAGSERE
jgi:dephospho-CoA kinase